MKCVSLKRPNTPHSLVSGGDGEVKKVVLFIYEDYLSQQNM